jgi:hypothetical protein
LERYLLSIRGDLVTSKKTAFALRIVTALNNSQRPESRDVALLRAYCPDHRYLPIEEVAGIAIQEMLESHKRKRQRTFGLQN